MNVLNYIGAQIDAGRAWLGDVAAWYGGNPVPLLCRHAVLSQPAVDLPEAITPSLSSYVDVATERLAQGGSVPALAALCHARPYAQSEGRQGVLNAWMAYATERCAESPQHQEGQALAQSVQHDLDWLNPMRLGTQLASGLQLYHPPDRGTPLATTILYVDAMAHLRTQQVVFGACTSCDFTASLGDSHTPIEGLSAAELIAVASHAYRMQDYMAAQRFAVRASEVAQDPAWRLKAANEIVWSTLRLGFLSADAMAGIDALYGGDPVDASGATTSVTPRHPLAEATNAWALYAMVRRMALATLARGKLVEVILMFIADVPDGQWIQISAHGDLDKIVPTEVVELLAGAVRLADARGLQHLGSELLQRLATFRTGLQRRQVKMPANMDEQYIAPLQVTTARAIDAMLAHAEKSAPTMAEQAFAEAKQLADAGVALFPTDISMWRRKTTALRHLAANLQKESRWSWQYTPQSALEEGLAAARTMRSMAQTIGQLDETSLLEYGHIYSEYAEHLIDARTKGGLLSAELSRARDEALTIALEALELAIAKFPENPWSWLNWGWRHYNVAKRDSDYGPSAKHAKRVIAQVAKLYQGHKATKEQYGEALRLFLWAANEWAYRALEEGQYETARRLLGGAEIRDYLTKAGSLVTGIRWRKDLLYAQYRFFYLLGRLLDGDRPLRVAALYGNEEKICTRVTELGAQQREAVDSFDEAMRYIDAVEPLEKRPGLVNATRGWIAARAGVYARAIEYFEKALKEYPKEGWEGWRADARRGLIEALRNRICQQRPTAADQCRMAKQIAVLVEENKATFNNAVEFQGSLKRSLRAEEVYCTVQ